MYTIDLNCDIGEGYGHYKFGNDAEIMNYVTSVNIACGFHGGDPRIMRETVLLAIDKNIAIGAHPGLPDLNGFGRREININPEEAYDLVVYQIGALQAFVTAEGGVMQHVKPHGALYNMAAKNKPLAEAIAKAIYKVNNELILFGLAGSALIEAGKKFGLQTAAEAFSDRTYMCDGSLASRYVVNSVLSDKEAVAKQAIRIVKEGKIKSNEGLDIDIKADTICLHGDGENALAIAREISVSLVENGITISNFLQK